MAAAVQEMRGVRADHQEEFVEYQTEITPGLEMLAQIDQIFFTHENEFVDVMFDVECDRRYSIVNNVGQRILYVTEKVGCCARCYGNYRPFEMNVMDYTGRVVLQLTRPRTYGLLCCPECCGNMIDVKAGLTGEFLGSVELAFNGLQPKYRILSSTDELVFIVLGPSGGNCANCTVRGTMKFNILLSDGETSVGQIYKVLPRNINDLELYEGDAHRSVPDPENFGATFPLDLDARMKAVVLAAVFMIDFQHVVPYLQNARPARRRCI